MSQLDENVSYLLKRLQANKYFRTSKPQWDEEFVKQMIKTYGFAELRNELNKMVTWCMANPEKIEKRTNKRKFIVNWMNGRDRKFAIPKGGSNE